MFEIYCIISFLFEPIILNKHLSLLPPLYFCSTTGLVPCSATPTTFGDLRAANGQGQQRRRITSVQPPTGLQEWLKMFQVTCLNTVLEMLPLVAVTVRDYSAMKRNMLHHGWPSKPYARWRKSDTKGHTMCDYMKYLEQTDPWETEGRLVSDR